jgi:RHS repeat-associated protein
LVVPTYFENEVQESFSATTTGAWECSGEIPMREPERRHEMERRGQLMPLAYVGDLSLLPASRRLHTMGRWWSGDLPPRFDEPKIAYISLNMTYDMDTTGAGGRAGEISQQRNPRRCVGDTSGSEGVNCYRLATYNGQAVSSDLDGNMLAAPLGGTLLGNLTWDARNRLTSAGNTTYAYDAEDRRTSRTIAGSTTTYTWSRGAVLDRLLVTTNPDGSTTRYIHGHGLLYEEHEPVGGGNATTQFYHFNWQGSTVALSDASGTVTTRMAYSAYGEVTIEGGSGFQLPTILPTPFLFNGQFGVLTEPNGLYAMQARFYSPVFRRFLSEDPAGFAGGINLYAYANGDPVNLMDPFGLGPVTSSWNDGIGAILTGAADGFRQGLDNFNNTVTFGLYDRMGWSRSYENVGWDHDLSRSLAAVPRDLAVAATAGAAAAAARQGATSALSALTNRASLAAGPSLVARTTPRAFWVGPNGEAAAIASGARLLKPSDAAVAAARGGDWSLMRIESAAWARGASGDVPVFFGDGKGRIFLNDELPELIKNMNAGKIKSLQIDF